MRRTPDVHILGYVPVYVVGDLVEGHAFVPGDELVADTADIEEYLQYGYEQREGEYIEYSRKYVQQYRTAEVALVGAGVPLENLPEFFHKDYKDSKLF